jgi:anti-sigma B factor antagonist
MEVRLTRTGDVLVARPRARWLDAQTAPALQRDVGAEIAGGVARVVVDLSEVENVDSAGLGALIRLLRLVPEGGRMVLAGCAPNVQRLLLQSRVDHVLPSYAGTEDALASFA